MSIYTIYDRIHAILFTAELSTPLLNLRWILRWIAQYTGKAAPLALSLAFAVLFILSRVALYGALILDLVKVRFNIIPVVSLLNSTYQL
jgi:TLC domain